MDLRDFGLSEEDLRALGYRVGNDAVPGERGEAEGSGAAGAPGTPTKPRRRLGPDLRIWIATLVVLPIVAWAASLGRRLPDPIPAAGPDASFSSARALAQLVEIAQRPHPTGSPDLIRVRSTLLGRASALGLEPEVQVTTAYVRDSSVVQAATVRNVLARIPGSGSTGALAVIAHYDGAPHSPGAGDNALGVATVLEAVRAIASGSTLRNDLILLFADGDEVGLLGTHGFLRQHPWAADVAAIVSVESRGVSGPALFFEAVPGNGPLLETLAASDPGHTGGSLFRALQGSALESAGATLPGPPRPFAALTVLGGRGWEDQVRDARERVDEGTLQHAGDQLLTVLRGLGGLDLARDLAGPERLYLSLPRVGFVHYPRAWNLLVTLGLVLLWVLMGLVIKLRRGTRNGLIAGLSLGLGSVGLSALAARSLTGLLGEAHPEYGLLATAFYQEAPHTLALVAVALALTTALYALARWWCRWDEVLFGAATVPLAFVVWLTFFEPLAAPAVQWPLALTLIASTLITVLGPRRGASAWTWGIVLVLSAATLVLAVPSLELAARAWTLRQATALGGLFGMAMLLLLPVLDWLRRPRTVATPVTAVAVAGALVALNLPSVQGAMDHPEPTTLVYLTDQDAAADPILRGATDTARVRTVVGSWLTVPGPGEEWSRSWVGDPPAGSTDAGVLLLGSDEQFEIAGSAPDAEIARPTATVVSSALAGGRRAVVLEVRSGLRGEMIGFVVPDGSPAELTGVGDATWPVGGIPVRRLEHWGLPDGGALRVGLSVPAESAATELVVIEHHLRPREILGDYFFQRPDSLIPSARTGSDRAIQRTTLSVEVSAPDPSALDGEQAAGRQDALEPPQ